MLTYLDEFDQSHATFIFGALDLEHKLYALVKNRVELYLASKHLVGLGSHGQSVNRV